MSMESLGIVSVAAITVICYLIGVACKAYEGLNDKWIPVVMGFCGAVLGAVAFLTKMPEFPGNDVITAIAIGIVSGFAATGINQVKKQLA